jgi:D-alanyl-D-alanine carboxypeptidase/D-alanyl-D-alanine-endopeptidase (penicillin-binding protein 4)
MKVVKKARQAPAGRYLALLILATITLHAEAPLDRRIEKLLAQSNAFWGLKAVSLTSGKTLAEHNAGKFFVPASNTKLFSTALALMRLGPDYRFITTVRIEGNDLALIGGGDPSIAARKYPYDKDEPQGDALAGIRQLAAQVAASGVKTVTGDVIGDDTAWPYDPYPDGWSQDDTLFEYGAPVSALTINDNAFRITVTPTNPPAIILNPALEYYTIHNQITRGAEGRVHYERDAGSRELRLSGVVTNRGWSQILAIDDPALYAARALKQELELRGIPVMGTARARHRRWGELRAAEEGTVVARRSSPPLSELLQVVDKVSQNLHAEIMLREVGRVVRGEATAAAGLEELKLFLQEAGVEKDRYRFVDGSGLSRLTLVTPDTIFRLLRHMHGSKLRDTWVGLLPVGGEDGTLMTRFRENKLQARVIHAKTGSLSHVSGLSGYIDSGKHGRVAFSLLVNNFDGPSTEVRKLMDDIALMLAE